MATRHLDTTSCIHHNPRDTSFRTGDRNQGGVEGISGGIRQAGGLDLQDDTAFSEAFQQGPTACWQVCAHFDIALPLTFSATSIKDLPGLLTSIPGRPQGDHAWSICVISIVWMIVTTNRPARTNSLVLGQVLDDSSPHGISSSELGCVAHDVHALFGSGESDIDSVV